MSNVSLYKPFKYISLTILVVIVAFTLFPVLYHGDFKSNYIIDLKLKDAITNTLILGIGVALITALLAVTLAVFNVFFEYKYKKTIHVLSLLPLTIPAYIHAYNFASMFQIGGSFYFTGIKMNSIYGAIFIYSICLFPYTYLIVRSTLKKIPYTVIESALLFESNFFFVLLKVIIPIASKSILAGTVLVLAEVYSDIALVDFYNINTIATVIREVYVTFSGDYGISILIGLVFGLVIVALFIGEKLLYRNMKFDVATISQSKQFPMKQSTKIMFYSFVIAVFSVSFFIPVAQMIVWSTKTLHLFNFEIFINNLKNTMFLAITSVSLIIIFALMITHTFKYTKKIKIAQSIYSIGYILPSMLTALLMVTFTGILINMGFGKIVIYSSLPLIIAYVFKYLSIGVNTIDKNYFMLNEKTNQSSIVLGKTPFYSFFKIDLPQLKTGIIGAIAVILIDVFKEYTLVYTLKPFNFETLATRVGIYAKDEMIQESSIHSLSIILICTILVLFLQKVGKKK